MSTPRPVPEHLLPELFRSPLDPGYAEAAKRRAAAGPASRSRVLTGRGLRAVIVAVIGFLLAVAYHEAVAAEPATSQARTDLVADVRARQRQTDELQRQADEVRDEVARRRDSALADGGAAQRLGELAAGAGLARVTGDGVAVRLADAPPPLDPVTGRPAGENPGVVLDRDLQDITNELWRWGAEAIAVNGQRLTATSTIRAAGGVILVDFRPLVGPYEVTAIGPSELADRFSASPTSRRFRGYVKTYRMQFGVKARNHLSLAAAPDRRLRYARVPGPSPSAASAGASGSAGPAGASGSAGPAGASGSAGPAGASGSAGPAGSPR